MMQKKTTYFLKPSAEPRLYPLHTALQSTTRAVSFLLFFSVSLKSKGKTKKSSKKKENVEW